MFAALRGSTLSPYWGGAAGLVGSKGLRSSNHVKFIIIWVVPTVDGGAVAEAGTFGSIVPIVALLVALVVVVVAVALVVVLVEVIWAYACCCCCVVIIGTAAAHTATTTTTIPSDVISLNFISLVAPPVIEKDLLLNRFERFEYAHFKSLK